LNPLRKEKGGKGSFINSREGDHGLRIASGRNLNPSPWRSGLALIKKKKGEELVPYSLQADGGESVLVLLGNRRGGVFPGT